MTETLTASGPRHADIIERYVRFWNAEFAGDQRRLADLAFTDDVAYHAPIGVIRGADALIGFRNEFSHRMGAVEFRLSAEPDVLDDRARLRWEVLVEGQSFAAGTDVVLLAEDGRISSVSAFLDRAPAGFDPHAEERVAVAREGRW